MLLKNLKSTLKCIEKCYCSTTYSPLCTLWDRKWHPPPHFVGLRIAGAYKHVGQTINIDLIMVVSYRSAIGIVIRPVRLITAPKQFLGLGIGR